MNVVLLLCLDDMDYAWWADSQLRTIALMRGVKLAIDGMWSFSGPSQEPEALNWTLNGFCR